MFLKIVLHGATMDKQTRGCQLADNDDDDTTVTSIHTAGYV